MEEEEEEPVTVAKKVVSITECVFSLPPTLHVRMF